MRKNYSTEQLDAIVADKLLFKAATKDVAEKHGFSRAFVDCTVATYRNVAEGNWEKIRFMLDGGQMQMKTVEWAAEKCGVTVPADLYEPKPEPEPETLEGQTMFPEFIKLDRGTSKTVWALIDALEKCALECGRLADQLQRR